MDLGCGTLHISTLLTGLKVLSPAAILHLLGDQELAGLGHLLACSSEGIKQRHKCHYQQNLQQGTSDLWGQGLREGRVTGNTVQLVVVLSAGFG